jgi:Fe-S cluster biogenesis protein NfuA
MTTDLKSRVAAVLRDEVAPALELDGGSIELVDITNGIAQVRFGVGCASCPSTIWPLIMGLEQELRARVPEIDIVEAVP